MAPGGLKDHSNKCYVFTSYITDSHFAINEFSYLPGGFNSLQYTISHNTEVWNLLNTE